MKGAFMRSQQEIEVLRNVIQAGERFGFGNCIQALSFAWAFTMKKKHGFDDAAALSAGLVSSAWDNNPKKLTPEQAKAVMDWGKEIMRGIASPD